MEGMVIVNTGNGKGKTTAALGMVLRNLGYNKKVCVIEFLKTPDFETGEKNFFKNNGIECISTGIGFSFEKTEEKQRESLRRAKDIIKEKTESDLDLLILDELNYLLSNKDFKTDDILSVKDVIDMLKKRNKKMTVVITGNNAPKELISFADTVTEMKMIKHSFNNGIPAQKGIEY